MTDYLARLNAEQREAVETVDGPLLVLAGAGTGKTRVLTTRFAHILLTGRAYPSQVLAVTFTNKAAREMRERVGAILGRPVEGLWLGTFHALCARMLRRHAEQVGLTSNFTILDTDDQLRLLKQVMEAERVDTKRWAPQALMAVIQRWKDRGLTPARVTPHEDTDFAAGRARALYAAYQARLRSLNAADFGDLLLHMTELLRDQPDVLAQYHRHVPLHPGGRIPGHQPGAVSLAAPARAGAPEHLLRRRRRSVDLFVARRRGGEHPALRARLSRAPRSFGWRRTTAPPRRSWPLPRR